MNAWEGKKLQRDMKEKHTKPTQERQKKLP